MKPSRRGFLGLVAAAPLVHASDRLDYLRGTTAFRRAATVGEFADLAPGAVWTGRMEMPGYTLTEMFNAKIPIAESLFSDDGDAVREMLGRWVSGLEPELLRDHRGVLIGLTIADLPLGIVAPLVVARWPIPQS